MQTTDIQIYSGLFVQYNDSKEFLMESHMSNPEFNPLDFKYIVQLAYPIVFVEVEALERTMEDFPLVEKTILQLVKEGYKEPAIIANFLGLTESYVSKLFKLLLGYGHIDNNGITKLGIESLEQESSIKKNLVRQRIQIDGVTANPIYVRKFISDQSLRAPKESGLHVAHLEPIEGIEKNQLIQIITDNYTNYVDKGEYALHTNVEDINSARFVDVKYAKAFYLENSNGESLIMCKSYDQTAKDLKERFGWKALYASSYDLITRCGLADDAPTSFNYAKNSVDALKRRLAESRKRSTKEVVDMINQLYSFDWNNTDFRRGDSSVIKVTKHSFRTYDKFILKVLESLADDGYDTVILEEMYGELITIKTDDESLMKVARAYKKKIEEVGRTTIMNAMERHSKKRGKDIFAVLQDTMTDIEKD